MLPVTKRRIVIVPNGLATIAAGVCLTFAAFQIAPENTEQLAADTSAASEYEHDQTTANPAPDGAGQDKAGDQAAETKSKRSSGLDFTFFLFPSR